MFKPEARAWLVATLASCSLLSACGESPDENAPPPVATAKPKAPKASGVGENMVAAVSSGQSAAAIGVHFSLTKLPTTNEGLPIDIAIVPHRDFSSVAVHFFSQDGLTLISGDSLGPLTDVTPEKTIKHQLVLMPVRDGVYMINASVETIGSDGTVSRIFSIPVVVAPPAPKPAAAAPPAATTPAETAPAAPEAPQPPPATDTG